MIEDFILNIHIYILIGLFFLSVALILAGGYQYRKRTGQLFISFFDFKKYNRIEKRYCYTGIILLTLSIVSFIVVLSTYGHYVKYTDINGKVTIERQKINF